MSFLSQVLFAAFCLFVWEEGEGQELGQGPMGPGVVGQGSQGLREHVKKVEFPTLANFADQLRVYEFFFNRTYIILTRKDRNK